MSREFILPKKLIYGENAVENAIPLIATMGKKAFVVSGKHVSKLFCFDEFIKMLEKTGVTPVVFTGITDEPTDTMIKEAVLEYQKNACDFLIAVGGGSPLDAMKAIAVLNSKDGDLSEYMGKMIEGDFPKMVAIPTTAGTGSETTKFTIITHSQKNIKMLLKGNSLMPDLAVVDYKFTVDSPKTVTAATGLDALTHAVESYTSKLSQPLTDTMALSAIKRIFKYLPVAVQNGKDLKAREQMSLAAFEAGAAINNASVTVVHGMSRPIGANFHVAHGISNAMLFCECLKFVADACYDKFAIIAREISVATAEDSDEIATQKFFEEAEKLFAICEVPTLKEYGIDEDKYYQLIDKMAEDAIASGSPSNTIKTLSKEDVVNLYQKLFAKSK